jgi:hypothetical protein
MDFVAVLAIIALLYLAAQPIFHPSTSLAPRYYVAFYSQLYGWILSILFVGLSIVLQYSVTKKALENIDSPPPKWYSIIAAGAIIVIIVGAAGATYLGDFAVAHLFLILISILIPGLWPSYVLIRRWEREHDKILIFSGLAFKTAD